MDVVALELSIDAVGEGVTENCAEVWDDEVLDELVVDFTVPEDWLCWYLSGSGSGSGSTGSAGCPSSAGAPGTAATPAPTPAASAAPPAATTAGTSNGVIPDPP